MISKRQLYRWEMPLGESVTRKEAGIVIYGDGGDSSSQSSSATTTTNIDKRQVNDGGSVGVTSDSSTVNVSLLDNGAVQKAIDLSAASTKTAYDGLKEALGFAGDVVQRQSDSSAGVNASATALAQAMTTTAGSLATQSGVIGGVVGDITSALTIGNKQALDTASGLVSSATGKAFTALDDLISFAGRVLTMQADSSATNADLLSGASSGIADAYSTAAKINSGQSIMVAGGLVLAGIVALKALGK